MARFIQCSYQDNNNHPVNINNVFKIEKSKSVNIEDKVTSHEIIFMSEHSHTLAKWSYPDENMCLSDFNAIASNEFYKLGGL